MIGKNVKVSFIMFLICNIGCASSGSFPRQVQDDYSEVRACLEAVKYDESMPLNAIPMYGLEKVTPEEKKSNDDFIAWGLNEYGDLEVASKDAVARGWKSYYQGDLSTAMKRFNQAWLFDGNNAEAYWGMGLVMGGYAETEKMRAGKLVGLSLSLLELANKKMPGNGRLLTDLGIAHMLLGKVVLAKQGQPGVEGEFAKAESLFHDAVRLEPDYPLAHFNWAVLELYRGNYEGAKAKLNVAVRLGYEPTKEFLQDLEYLRGKE